ncbi:MAG: Rho termination factor N-terminal domain-containing protein, partial [Jatrophihabitantaceae bacterium]
MRDDEPIAGAKRGSLTTLLLPELQQVARGLGISTTKKKKSDLIAAIQAARTSSSAIPEAGPVRRSSTAEGEYPAADSGPATESRTGEQTGEQNRNGRRTEQQPRQGQGRQQNQGGQNNQNRQQDPAANQGGQNNQNR